MVALYFIRQLSKFPAWKVLWIKLLTYDVDPIDPMDLDQIEFGSK